jgi:acyltransferase 3
MPLKATSTVGYVGVAFFFVLSGFVLTWSTPIYNGVEAKQFWIKRVARVYPSHLVMMVIALLLPATPLPLTWVAVPPNALLLQSWFSPNDIAFGVNAVSWSLSCEAFFYLCAPLLISVLNALKPLQRYLAAAAGAGVAWSIGLVMAANGANVYAYHLPIVRIGEFIIGIALALALRDGVRLPFRSVCLAGVTTAVMVMVCLRTGQLTTVSGILMAPAFAWLIYACAQADLDGVRGVLRLKLLEHLGITSFAFYLVHELVLLNLKPLPWPHGSKLVNLATVIVLWVICQAAAELLYRGVERPAQRRIRAWAAAHKGKNETKAGHYSLQPGRASGQAGTPGTGVDDAGNGTSVTGGHRLDSAGSAAGAGHDGTVA